MYDTKKATALRAMTKRVNYKGLCVPSKKIFEGATGNFAESHTEGMQTL